MIAAIAGRVGGLARRAVGGAGGLVNIVGRRRLRGRARARARRRPAAGGTVARAMFRAEAAKILVIVGQLWLVLTTYKDIVPAAFFAAFVVTVLHVPHGALVRD